ncbi:MAG: hypothetical protein AAF943_15610 [Pseudomonadota bacterium]
MLPHPDFAAAHFPRAATLATCTLTPLDMAQTEEDFAAVTSSAAVLDGVFGDWPAGLTLEDNRIDLAWHDREFTCNRSFSWIIRGGAEAYLGCLYLFPEIGARGTAEAVIWLRKMPDRDALARQIFPDLMDWLTPQVPPEVRVQWTQSPAV